MTQIVPPPAQVLLNAIPQLCSIWLLTLLGGGWKSVLSVASNDPSKGLASLKKSVFAFNIVIDVIALGGAITAVVAVGNNDIAPRPRDGQLQQNERTQAQQNAPSCPPPIIQPLSQDDRGKTELVQNGMGICIMAVGSAQLFAATHTLYVHHTHLSDESPAPLLHRHHFTINLSLVVSGAMHAGCPLPCRSSPAIWPSVCATVA